MSALGSSLRVQCVLFNQTLGQIERLVAAVGASARVAADSPAAVTTHLVLGDCSPSPVAEHDAPSLEPLSTAAGLESVSYEYFGVNLGSAGGSNRLAAGTAEDFLLVLNPDTYPSPPLLERLISAFSDPTVGCADARQIPLDHPKEYNLVTGDTSWASGSCLMVRTDVFHNIGGFDAEHFFLYCDDVDFSWRVRLSGFRVVHVPDALVFHDKRVDLDGTVSATEDEEYYGLLGRLMLGRRYMRPDVVSDTLSSVAAGGSVAQRRAVEEWQRRLDEGMVPSALAGGAAVAQFIDGEYARHRF